jgi:tetratricopeptide (TPR) repeat protein/tRNA A-37 threonylcarbamoyl transferase component Bud32
VTTDRWERLTDLFHSAVALPPEERERFLAESCAGDAKLEAEVERLVAAHDRAGQFIETPAAAHFDALPDESARALTGRRVGPFCVVREIGRGGMGAVYLAERADGQFEQRVAIKLIKRGMDTDLVLERFRAERQILASLEHPNIARLLDGGTTDDGQPYFVMEYIEGEPIDAYADRRTLSVAERLELFLQTCSAVSYAHRHRVIHRDLKPVNVLVTADGVPKLLDFGIAKVLDAGSNEPTSSITAVRLLTPEYASPEQVEGRHATPASDVYSLGVVLYELLTGRSPYRLTSRDPVDVAAAVRTTDPERPSTAVSRSGDDDARTARRRGVQADRAAATGTDSEDKLRRRLRGDLDTIVLTALRKEPERRYATVDAFADDIRRHLGGQPVRARPDAAGYRAAKFVQRTRAAVVAAGVAGLVVALGAAALTRTARRSATVDRPGVLAERDRVLVADLADRAGDPTLAAALSDAFRVDITESPFVQVLSARQIRSTLARMERSPDIALDDSLAREVAVREGVKALVTGNVARVAGQYTITAQLTSAEQGDMLAAVRETAADSTDLIGALDRLAKRLRERMGESLPSISAAPRLQEVTTASLPALRKYSEAQRLIRSGDRISAVRLLEEAVALDTGFAAAYRTIALTYGDMLEGARARMALQHAMANQSRLPFLEQYMTLAINAMNTEDYAGAIDAYRHILERYPDDVRALNNLGLAYSYQRRFATEESLLVRAIAIDSTIPSMYGALAMALVNEGKYADARRWMDRLEERYPGTHNAELAEIYLAASQQDWDAAERKAGARVEHNAADSLDMLDGLETLAGVLMTRGRLAEAEQDSRRVMALGEQLRSAGRYYSAAHRVARLELRYRHAPAKAIAVMNAALARFPLDSAGEGDRAFDLIARLYADAGQVARAKQLVEQAEALETPLERQRGPDADRRYTLGVIAMAEGRVWEGELELRRAADEDWCPICVLPALARAYEVAGKPDSAIATYERYAATPWEWRFETDNTELGFTRKRLGELYERRGDVVRARAHYTAVLELWRRADPELQPVVAEVRQRLAHLGVR